MGQFLKAGQIYDQKEELTKLLVEIFSLRWLSGLTGSAPKRFRPRPEVPGGGETAVRSGGVVFAPERRRFSGRPKPAKGNQKMTEKHFLRTTQRPPFPPRSFP